MDLPTPPLLRVLSKFLLCAGIIAAVGCASGHKLSGASSHPPENTCPFETPYRAWFFRPPPGAIVGYPQQKLSAQQDALVRIKGYSRMFVKGVLRNYVDDETFDKQDSISFYFDETDTAAAGRFTCADSFFICCPGFACLMSPDSGTTIDRSDLFGCETQPEKFRPGDDPARLLGEGSCRLRYYNQAGSWMTAEEEAIKMLCRQSVISYASLRKMTEAASESAMSTTYRYEMDLEVRNVSIISRYYDSASNACTVWAACQKADIHPWKESGR